MPVSLEPGQPRPRRRAVGLALALAAWAALAAAQEAPRLDMRLEVSRAGEEYVVDASLFVPVSPREAWAVLTDFDRMGAFVPNLSHSEVVGTEGGKLIVSQKGVARYGPLAFPFESVRVVELQPYAVVRSINIRGNMRKLESTTRLEAQERGTRVRYHVQAIPGFWFPDFLAETLLKHEVAEQFEAIADEMLRRRDAQ